VLVWLNGRLVAARDARVSVLDRGLLHGDGVYDTWRTYGGRPFAVAAHLRRVAAGTHALGLPAPGPVPRWERRTRILVARNGLGDAAVRLTITRGAAGDALVPEHRSAATVLLTVRRLPPDLAQRRRDGIAAVLLDYPRDAAPPWASLKLVGHASAVAGRLDADEALYVTRDGDVPEATTANLFLVERGGLVTPPADGTILPGVTRSLVLALARRAGIAVREERVSRGRLRRAREAFLTASTIEIVPLVRLDGSPIGDGRPGDATRRLQLAYAALVRRALARG
jgi:branched-subunit amino acid aminotransferase/4-amino-4-deoxychorismate lyase